MDTPGTAGPIQAGTDGPAKTISGTRPGGDGFSCRPAVVSLSPVIRANRGPVLRTDPRTVLEEGWGKGNPTAWAGGGGGRRADQAAGVADDFPARIVPSADEGVLRKADGCAPLPGKPQRPKGRFEPHQGRPLEPDNRGPGDLKFPGGGGWGAAPVYGVGGTPRIRCRGDHPPVAPRGVGKACRPVLRSSRRCRCGGWRGRHRRRLPSCRGKGKAIV